MVVQPLALVLALGWGVAHAQTSEAPDISKTLAQEAAAVPPAPPLTPERRGDLFMVRRMYREAIEAFSEGPKNDPQIVCKTGIAYHQLSQLDKAKKSYERAIKLKPDYAEAHNNLGVIYYAQRNYRRAINSYKKALQYSPGSASIHMNMGTALFARKRYQEASDMYRKALELDPEVFEHRGSYGVLLEERTIEERAKFHYYVAKLYASQNRSELALQYLRKALEEGFKERKKLNEDPEFTALRETPEFQELLKLEPRVL